MCVVGQTSRVLHSQGSRTHLGGTGEPGTVTLACLLACLLVAFDAPLTFPLVDDHLSPGLDVSAEVLHHAVDEVIQRQAARLRADRLAADWTLVFALAPLGDAVQAEDVGAVQHVSLSPKNRHGNI